MQETTISKKDIIDFLNSKYSLCKDCYINCPYYIDNLWHNKNCGLSVVINGLNKEVTSERNELSKKSAKGKSRKKKSKES